MIIFDIFLTISDPNIHQNAPNCTILKTFFRGGDAPKPPTKAHGFAEATCKFSNLKKKFLTPLPNPGYAPLNSLFRKMNHLRASDLYTCNVDQLELHLSFKNVLQVISKYVASTSIY